MSCIKITCFYFQQRHYFNIGRSVVLQYLFSEKKHVCVLSQECSPKLSTTIGNSDQVGRRWRIDENSEKNKKLKIRAEGKKPKAQTLIGVAV